MVVPRSKVRTLSYCQCKRNFGADFTTVELAANAFADRRKVAVLLLESPANA